MNYECFPSSQVFFNWKNQLRTRAKKLKQIQDGKTGADDKLALQKLTDVEKRALKLWKEDFQDKDIASVSETTVYRYFIISPSLSIRFAFAKAENYFIDLQPLGFFPYKHIAFRRAEENKFTTCSLAATMKWDAPHFILEAYASFSERDIRSHFLSFYPFENGWRTRNVEKKQQQKAEEFSCKRYNKIVYETCDPKKKFI